MSSRVLEQKLRVRRDDSISRWHASEARQENGLITREKIRFN